ncbi:MAG: DUF6614 family protein [Myxococcota bacterium]
MKPGVSDVAFCESVDAYLGRLREDGRIEGFRIMRRKLGLGPSDLGEFHIIIDVNDLAQLDDAFRAASKRSGEVEVLHAAVNQHARDLQFALYRDFPDAHREKGNEKF